MNQADITANVEIILSHCDPSKPQCARQPASHNGDIEVVFSEQVDLLGALYQEQDEEGKVLLQNICTNSLSGVAPPYNIPALLTFGFRFIGTDQMLMNIWHVLGAQIEYPHANADRAYVILAALTNVLDVLPDRFSDEALVHCLRIAHMCKTWLSIGPAVQPAIGVQVRVVTQAVAVEERVRTIQYDRLRGRLQRNENFEVNQDRETLV